MKKNYFSPQTEVSAVMLPFVICGKSNEGPGNTSGADKQIKDSTPIGVAGRYV